MYVAPESAVLQGGDAEAGAVFPVDIVLDGVEDLGAFEFEITVHTNYFEYGAFEVGAFFNSTGRSAACLQNAQDGGSANFGCTSTGALPPGPDGAGTVATVNLVVQGLAAGETTIQLANCTASDVLGQGLPVSGCKNAKIDINPNTPTPPEFLRMEMLPRLQNVFLTAQGAKVPPPDCLAGGDVAVLEERLSLPVPDAPDPKDPEQLQQVGAFEFEVHYDSKDVCVVLVPGPAAGNMTCIVEDAVTKPQLEGIARLGCATIGKEGFPDTNTEEGRLLAEVLVYPQPELYSLAKPAQDNGVVVQINNVNCDLADLQGHPIAVLGCDDADITYRYLEGDVEPDCVLDALDAQSVAFRWGTEKGSLIYKDFMNLEPSGAQQDSDIDTNDIQVVLGRFGSTCDDPHPPQEPQNPKGVETPPPTPTATNTPTPTVTPPESKPRVNLAPPEQDLVLTAPPASGLCADSPDAVTFDVLAKDPITSEDPKAPGELQELGAFEFELQYDDTFLCIEVAPGPVPQDEMNCVNQVTEGLIHYGCTTIPGLVPSPQPPGVLATITVQVEPDVYALVGPADKWVFDLVTKNCKLGDLLGHSIKSTSCAGAVLSVHYPPP